MPCWPTQTHVHVTPFHIGDFESLGIAAAQRMKIKPQKSSNFAMAYENALRSNTAEAGAHQAGTLHSTPTALASLAATKFRRHAP